jgi:hypothetical protein
VDGDVKVKHDDFEPGELDELLAEGERSGKPLNARQVFRELRELGKRAKKSQKRTGIRVRLPMPPIVKRK